MSDLLVIAFSDDAAAFRARAEFVGLQRDYLVEMEDVVVVTRGPDGRVQLHQAVNLTAAGAVGGTMWGALVGLLFLNPLLGAAVGAASGAAGGALADLGIPDGFLREVGGSLDNGGAALAVLLRKLTADRVLDRLAGLGGRVVQTSLPHDVEARLRDRLAGGASVAASVAAPAMALSGAPSSHAMGGAGGSGGTAAADGAPGARDAGA